jgi:CDP-diacylglycerol--glycerol-3-phosphate 3-phosphatidyltransferase
MSTEVTPSFGPSALLTPANAVTLTRLALSPILLVVIASGGASWFSLSGWVVLTASDGIDGYIARRQGVTSSGAFLDPLADKVLVLGALGALVVRGDLWWLPAGLIAVREVVVSVFRSRLAQRGISVPARWWAKVKTVVSEIAIGFALLPPTTDVQWFYKGLIWVAVVLTLVTGVQYLSEGGRRVRAG